MKRLFRLSFTSTVAVMTLIVAVVALAIKDAEVRVEKAVRQNFTAAGLLARIQIEGERMRRYEKEAFIYAAVPANRDKYVKEHGEAHSKLLALLTEAGAPSSQAFSDAERQELLRWVEATAFYAREFARIADNAAGLNLDTMPADQKAALPTRLNTDIKEGKDRFAALLSGATKMREAKEKSSILIGDEIRDVFRSLLMKMLVIAAVVVVAAAWRALRKPEPASAPGLMGTRQAGH